MSALALYPATLSLVLAGGRSIRMGDRDKAFVELGGRSLLQHVLDRFAPQCEAVMISSNASPALFETLEASVLADCIGGFQGPLAGILTGLEWLAKYRPDIEWLASAPVDCPFLPSDLVAKLHSRAACEGTQLAVASSGGRLHPVAALWHVSLCTDLRDALVTNGLRKAHGYLERHKFAEADFVCEPCDPFLNVNSEADIAMAERILRNQE